jgi:hypothetical protein
MVPGPRPNARHVMVIADSRETIDGLQAYLQRAGVASHAARALGDASSLPPSTSVVVLFPDDFEATQVASGIESLRSSRPELLIIVITSAPQRLGPALGPAAEALLPVVLSKPVFGWTILDAIRERAVRLDP